MKFLLHFERNEIDYAIMSFFLLSSDQL